MDNNQEYTNWGGSNHPPKIYKYRKWNKPLHRTILTENEIFFAKPLDITADFELLLKTDYDSVTEQDKINYFYNQSLGIKFNTNEERIDFVKQQVHKTALDDETLRDLIDEKYRSSLNNIVGYFCATEKRNSHYLWSSSFAGHTNGFCVGFHTKLMFPEEDVYTGGNHVVYFSKENEPTIRPFYGDDKEGRMDDHLNLLNYLPAVLFAKEEEYRIVRAISITGQKAIIPTEAYAEIIVGSNLGASDIEVIKDIKKNRFPDVPLLQAVNNKGVYTFNEIG